MRILLLATEIYKSHGGVQRYTQELADLLAASKHEVHTVSLNDSPLSNHDFIGFSENKIRFIAGTATCARKIAPSCIIAAHVALSPIALMLKTIGLGAPYVVILHGLEAWKRLRYPEIMACRRAAKIVATTSYTAREFCYYNPVDRATVEVAHLAATLETSHPTQEHPRTFTILSVARLSARERYKGVDTVIAAVAALLREGQDVRLIVVGDGDDRPRLQRLTGQLGVSDVVKFMGRIPDHDLALAYSTADVFALPSRREGFGIVYLEAMTAGLPCIAANHGGVPEVISHGEEGFLIEYGKVDDLVWYLRLLIDQPELAALMSKKASERVATTFSRARMQTTWNRFVTESVQTT